MALLRSPRREGVSYVVGTNQSNEDQLCGADHIFLRVTINALPDNVLLDIFEFYRAATINKSYSWAAAWLWPWNRLVHVCQRWRYVMFASPLRLDLCLRCTWETPVRETLDFWPPLPIEIFLDLDRPYDVDNTIAVLKHCDRVRGIWILNLISSSSQLERLVPMMQEPFPRLTFLQLEAADIALVLPDLFLGGSAPRLQTLVLSGIPFPGLPRLLLSATDLSHLSLEGIPHTGYISPEAMVISLSALTRLTRLIIKFKSPTSRHLRRRGRCLPPLTRAILPALTKLEFRGISEYLEDLVARIDVPRFQSLDISFFNQVIFDIRQLSYFIGHTRILRSSSHMKIIVADDHVEINLYPTDPPNNLKLRIYCRAIDWQVWSIGQICNQFSLLLSIVEQLDIHEDYYEWTSSRVDMEDTQWLELFRPFIAVRTLWISQKLQPLILPAMQELTGERATEVLPALASLYLQKYKPSISDRTIEPFIAARQHSDHPVTVHPWEGLRL